MKILRLSLVALIFACQIAIAEQQLQYGVLFRSYGISEFHLAKAKVGLLAKLNEGTGIRFGEQAMPSKIDLPLHQKDFSAAKAHLVSSGKFLASAQFAEALAEADKGLALTDGASLFYDCNELRVQLRVGRIQAILGLEKTESLTPDLQQLVNDKPDFQFTEKIFSPRELTAITKVLADIVAPSHSIVVKPTLENVQVVADGRKMSLVKGVEDIGVAHLPFKKIFLSATKSGYFPFREEIVLDGPETKILIDLKKMSAESLLAPRNDRTLEESIFFAKLAQSASGNSDGLLLVSIERAADSSFNLRAQAFKVKAATFSKAIGVNYRKSFLLLDPILSHFSRELIKNFL